MSFYVHVTPRPQRPSWRSRGSTALAPAARGPAPVVLGPGGRAAAAAGRRRCPAAAAWWCQGENQGECHGVMDIWLGLSRSSWGYPFIAGWFSSWKLPSFEMDDWGYPHGGTMRSYHEIEWGTKNWFRVDFMVEVEFVSSCCFANSDLWGKW